MAQLFERDQSVVAKHARAALREEEVTEKNFRQILPKNTRGRPSQMADLDVIISVGYRVKSLRGVQFRRWATTVLKDHLIKGHTVNQKRLDQLHQGLHIVSRSVDPQVAGVANVLKAYAEGLTLLDDYDHQRVPTPESVPSDGWVVTLDDARDFVASMRFTHDSELFGRERDESFASSIATIYQGFNNQEFYPSLPEKAANLLYLVVKNHSFMDGNKRIAAGLFVYFLDRNNILFDTSGNPVIDNAALAGLTLMIALSEPREKDVMCNLVMNALTWKSINPDGNN
jgi:prophage maintenance system killer protein